MTQISPQEQAKALKTLREETREAVSQITSLEDVELLAVLSRITSEIRRRLSESSASSEAREPIHLVDEDAHPVADLLTPEQKVALVNVLLQRVNESIPSRPVRGKGIVWEEVKELVSE